MQSFLKQFIVFFMNFDALAQATEYISRVEVGDKNKLIPGIKLVLQDFAPFSMIFSKWKISNIHRIYRLLVNGWNALFEFY